MLEKSICSHVRLFSDALRLSPSVSSSLVHSHDEFHFLMRTFFYRNRELFSDEQTVTSSLNLSERICQSHWKFEHVPARSFVPERTEMTLAVEIPCSERQNQQFDEMGSVVKGRALPYGERNGIQRGVLRSDRCDACAMGGLLFA